MISGGIEVVRLITVIIINKICQQFKRKKANKYLMEIWVIWVFSFSLSVIAIYKYVNKVSLEIQF